MKYVLRYSFGCQPSVHDVMELMVSVEQQSGEVCESIELVSDLKVAPGFVYYEPKDDADDWKGE